MQISVNHVTLSDLPVALVYLVYPIISAVSNLLGLSSPNYDMINIGVFSTLIFIWICYNHRVKKNIWVVIITIICAVIYKYIIPSFYNCDVVWRALFIDVKWIVYLLLSLFWINGFGGVNSKKLYNWGKIYAIVYIVYVVLMTIKTGHFSRSNSGLLSECNYDCFLLLIPLCFCNEKCKNRKDILLFIFAIIISTSKTGIMSMLSILCCEILRRTKYKLLVLGAFIIVSAIWGYVFFIRSGIIDNGDIDRVVYFAQFFDYINNTSLRNVVFGIFPGVAMQLDPITSFEWTIHKFESINNITGSFPFIFHSTYMRLGIVWGIPIVVIGIVCLLKILITTKYITLKNLLIIFFLESVSLSSLSLESISFVFILVLISALTIHYKYDQINKKHFL